MNDHTPVDREGWRLEWFEAFRRFADLEEQRVYWILGDLEYSFIDLTNGYADLFSFESLSKANKSNSMIALRSV